MSETFYIKKGRKYIPVGQTGPELWNGIWLVESKPGSTSYKNLCCRLSDLPDRFDLQILAKVTLLEDIIINVMNEAWKDGRGASLAEVASKIATKLATHEIKLTTRKLRGP